MHCGLDLAGVLEGKLLRRRDSSSRTPVDIPGSVEVIDQPGDAPDLVVFYVDRLSYLDDYDVYTDGDRPFVIVAQGDIVIDASITVNGIGFPSAVCPPASPGEGPGGGGFSTGGSGGGGEGGAFCTLGGLGAGMTSHAGTVYGNPELVPLIGGSSGGIPGNSSYNGHSGAGGGLMQLVSATRIEVRAAGILEAVAPSFGQDAASNGSGRYGGGGGAGGAILLEAPEVIVNGTIRATGAPGGGAPYAGAAATSTMSAGAGTNASSRSGGGGGGLGRIRINTASSPMVAIDALLVPNPASGCASYGPLLPETAGLGETIDCEATPDPATTCDRCLDDACCAAVTACAASTLCSTCVASSSPGPGCGADPDYGARAACAAASCASACAR